LLRRPRSTAPPAEENQPGRPAFDATAIAAAIWHATQGASPSVAASAPGEIPSRWKLEGRSRQLDRLP
jgi:hypothetical protein